MFDPQLELVETAQPDTKALVERLVAIARPKNTRRTYEKEWLKFRRWCEKKGRAPLPASAETVAEYLAAGIAERLSLDSLKVRRAAIRDKHVALGHVNPCRHRRVRDLWTGFLIAYKGRTRPTIGVLSAGIERVVRAIDEEVRAAGPFAPARIGVAAARDRALVLLLWNGLLTRAEAASLQRDQIGKGRDGLTLRVERSAGRERTVDVRYHRDVALCSVRALGEWIRLAEITEGPVFRRIDAEGRLCAAQLSTEGVREIWRRRAGLAGLDVRLVTVRSVRDGGLKQAAYDGLPDAALLDLAGLNEESRPLVATRVESARALRRRDDPAPATL